jgi:CRISPR-associated protein Csd2
MDAIQRRYDFVLLFEVTNGNPNGDPDAGNSPRIDPETGHGFVSDVCLKRKIRNYICLAKSAPGTSKPQDGYDIYVKEGSVLNRQHQRAYDEAPALKDSKGKDADKISEARRWMCQTFFDIRMFGAVMTTGVNCGQVRGPVQLAFSRSIDPITPLEQSVTRMAVTTDKESEKQEGGNRTMGRKEIVPYALYVCHGFISPHLAIQTGFSDNDLKLLWDALKMMFEHDHSAARGEMNSRKLLVFEHESLLGNAPAHSLFERIKIARKDLGKPARFYADYDVVVEKTGIPQGIILHEML